MLHSMDPSTDWSAGQWRTRGGEKLPIDKNHNPSLFIITVQCCCQFYCNYDRRNKFHLLCTPRPTAAATGLSYVCGTTDRQTVHLSSLCPGDKSWSVRGGTTREQGKVEGPPHQAGTDGLPVGRPLDAYSESRMCTFMWVTRWLAAGLPGDDTTTII